MEFWDRKRFLFSAELQKEWRCLAPVHISFVAISDVSLRDLTHYRANFAPARVTGQWFQVLLGLDTRERLRMLGADKLLAARRPDLEHGHTGRAEEKTAGEGRPGGARKQGLRKGSREQKFSSVYQSSITGSSRVPDVYEVSGM
eukprot:92250-Hanusia_phi.AAC.1